MKERNKMNKYTGIVCALAALSGIVHADMISISGDSSTSISETGSAFNGLMDYSFSGGESGVLTISLTNTTEASIGGFLTGFVFNMHSSDDSASIALSSASNVSFLDTGVESASPFGMYDSGAALGANWTGGGSPSFGIGTGESATFDFTIFASDASSLTASSFITTDNDFAVRFRGLNNGGSDKLTTTPAPSAAALLAMSGLIAGRRRRS